MAKKQISYERRKQLYGYGFISLWLVGTVVFFLIPLVKSLWFSFNDVGIDINRTVLTWRGLGNYDDILNKDPKYLGLLKNTLIETLWKTPLILIFSLFIAVMLNQKFRGRALARAVFFLPAIIATGPVYTIISGDMNSTGNTQAAQFSTLFSTDLIGSLLNFLGIYGISDSMSGIISGIADNIFGIVWSSGIQILLFLGALQNIPPSAKEAAQIEGATAWEFFWKITLPYVSPFILANLIFTVIDSFTSPTNAVMERILSVKEELRFGTASAMAWFYFAVIFAALGVAALIVNRFIYYEND
ncbi:MAG: sugar ABC transporter permease [Ruminococcus sp.]|nr:sugar ABC transporter permease [Ruminococcus sp.]MCR5075787.1 sugar ABC transporter permease [Ruminococcus sp.]